MRRASALLERLAAPPVRTTQERYRHELKYLINEGEHGVANVARLKVVGRIPVNAQLTVIDLRHADVERHGLFKTLAKALVVLLDLGRNRRGDLLILVLGDRQIVDIGRSKDQGFSHLAVVLDHLGQASLGQIRAQVLDSTVELAAERFAAQRTIEQNVAPVVACAALPARAIGWRFRS